jgi:hypothetical protein
VLGTITDFSLIVNMRRELDPSHGTYCLYACCRYIVQYAAECGGVIVSTDNYRDLLQENPAWRETIETRLGKYSSCPTLWIFVLSNPNSKL